jgi:hypothetical protein
LLTVDMFQGFAEEQKISGTTDVIITKSENVLNDSIRGNIEALFEIKTPKVLPTKDHGAQIVVEHFAASYLNHDHPVVSVLTDLVDSWTFLWFALNELQSKVNLLKLRLSGESAASEAKYLLDSLFHCDKLPCETLPESFSNRVSFDAIVSSFNKAKRARQEFEREDNERSPDRDFKKPPGSDREDSTDRGTRDDGNNSSRAGGPSHEGDGGSGSMNMAQMLSLFAPPGDRDIANELDLLDMVDVDEQYEIVRAFFAKHVVPYMVPP